MCFFFFKQKTAYEVRISDGSSDVCSSDLIVVAMFAAWRLGAAFMPVNPELTRAEALYQVEDSGARLVIVDAATQDRIAGTAAVLLPVDAPPERSAAVLPDGTVAADDTALLVYTSGTTGRPKGVMRSEEHTSELQSLMRTSYA